MQPTTIVYAVAVVSRPIAQKLVSATIGGDTKPRAYLPGLHFDAVTETRAVYVSRLEVIVKLWEDISCK